MLERREAVEVLLASKLNWVPPLKVASSYADLTGPVGGDRVRCNRCRETGRVIGEGTTAAACPTCRQAKRAAEERGHRYTAGCTRCRPCLLCDATGWRPLIDSEYDENGERIQTARQPYFAGETGEDEYLRPGKHELWADAHTRAELHRIRDQKIERLQEQARIRAGMVDTGRGYGWERDRDAHYRHGSYVELERLLEQLRDRMVVAWSCVLRVYVYEPHLQLRSLFGHSALEAMADVGACWVEERMPELIRVPSWLLPEADAKARKESLWRGRGRQVEQRQARDEQLRELRERLTVDELGARFALSRSQVYAILADGIAVASGPAA